MPINVNTIISTEQYVDYYKNSKSYSVITETLTPNSIHLYKNTKRIKNLERILKTSREQCEKYNGIELYFNHFYSELHSSDFNALSGNNPCYVFLYDNEISISVFNNTNQICFRWCKHIKKYGFIDLFTCHLTDIELCLLFDKFIMKKYKMNEIEKPNRTIITFKR